MKKISLILAILVLVALGGYALFRELNPYYGLVTQMDVQSTPEDIALIQAQLSSALASIEASLKAEQEPDLNMYEVAGQSAYYLGDLAQAREIYEKYLKIHKINPVAWNTYATILYRMEDWKKAEEAYRKALELSVTEENYRDLIRVIAKDDTRDSEIETLLLNYVDTLGQTQWVMVELATWYEAHSQCQKAIDHLKVARSIARDQGADISILEEDIKRIKATCAQ